jgi:hypothetical protein
MFGFVPEKYPLRAPGKAGNNFPFIVLDFERTRPANTALFDIEAKFGAEDKFHISELLEITFLEPNH